MEERLLNREQAYAVEVRPARGGGQSFATSVVLTVNMVLITCAPSFLSLRNRVRLAD